jgi:hypothetical protein
MTTTLELPDDLMREVTRRAAQEGQDLKQTVAQLLRKGLAVETATAVQANDEALLTRRKEIAEKFLSGEWGAQLDGFEAGRAADRESARQRDERWRP